MNKFSSVNRNLIVISVISTILVFWLSTSFWVVAFTQRNAAVHLEDSAQPEHRLFQLAANIGQQRLLANSLLLSDSLNQDALDKLHELSNSSSELMEQAFVEIQQSRNVGSTSVEHRYSDNAIQSLSNSLHDDFARLSQATSVIIEQTAMPLPERDDGVRMQLFDAYAQLIEEVNHLRHRTRFLPEINSQNVIAAHELNNAMWRLYESVNKNRTLLAGLLIKTETSTLENIDGEGLLLRSYQHHQEAERSIFEITEFFESNNADTTLRDKMFSLFSVYKQQYKPSTDTLLANLKYKQPQTQNATQFGLQSATLIQTISDLSNATVNQTIATAQRLNKKATRNLIIDTLLVLLCVGMAIASMRVSRNVQHQATHDDLTKLPNRRYFAHQLQRLMSKTDTNKNKLVLITIDLDRFKSINDTMGHPVGDKLLRGVATRLNEQADCRMTVARMGGDEFAVVFITDDASESNRFADALKLVLASTFYIDGNALNVGASFGISQYPDDASTADALQVASDFAMFHAKQDGESRIQHYDRDMAERFENRLHLERDLNVAITDGQLELYYQPQFNVKENRVDAVEALIRWHHPTKGFMPPDEFVGIAEEFGLMPAMGKWVLDEACRQVAAWNSEDNLAIRVAVNVSVHQIMQRDFVDQVLEALARNDLHAKYLEVEITESVVIGDVDWIIESLLRLKDAGIKIALDDFGTGYSSLSQLQHLPIDTLKIDRAFISTLENPSEAAHSFTATIAKLADTLGLETVAEGVETASQLAQVAELGIDVVQGYYYSKPVASSDVAAVVKSIDSGEDTAANAA